MTGRAPGVQTEKHLPGIANRSIIPAWGPCPKAGLWGPQPQFICNSLRDRLDISTEVVYDSGIAMAADRVGRSHRCSGHPSDLSQYTHHAGGRSVSYTHLTLPTSDL